MTLKAESVSESARRFKGPAGVMSRRPDVSVSSEGYFFSFSLAAGTGAALSAGAGAGFLASFFGFLASLLLRI
jgi:hypothetical protein